MALSFPCYSKSLYDNTFSIFNDVTIKTIKMNGYSRNNNYKVYKGKINQDSSLILDLVDREVIVVGDILIVVVY